MPQLAAADLLAPDSPGSPQADASRTAYVVMVVLLTLVALGVVAALLRAARGRGGGAGDEPSRRTRGTAAVQRRVGAGLSLAVVVFFVFGVILTERAKDVEASESDAEPVTIQVDGQQWVWRYEYPAPEDNPDDYSPDAPFSYHDLYIPVDTPITLDVSSVDVQHRWFVPGLTRAVDAIPGEENTVTFMADETGEYEGRSTEFSGAGYSTMRTKVFVVEQEEYADYIDGKIDEINEAREAVQDEVESGRAPGVALQEDAPQEAAE